MAPSRTFKLIVSNTLSVDITKTFEHLCHGEFTPGLLPPGAIPAGRQGVWRSESDGVLTGTEGYVKFNLSGQTVYIYWDNPFEPAFLDDPSTRRASQLKTLVAPHDIEP